MDKNEIITQLKSLLGKSYAPYSSIRVAAATVYESDGHEAVAFGVNVENSSYGLTICAERASIFAAKLAGMTEMKEMYLMSNLPDPIRPCGACRQVMSEFINQSGHTPITCLNEKGEEITFSFEELLPNRFKK